jgi:hypothetical protein
MHAIVYNERLACIDVFFRDEAVAEHVAGLGAK